MLYLSEPSLTSVTTSDCSSVYKKTLHICRDRRNSTRQVVFGADGLELQLHYRLHQVLMFV